MASKKLCEEVVAVNPGHFTRPCGYPAKATRYQPNHTYPTRVCGIHGRMAERMGLPIVWDQGTTR